MVANRVPSVSQGLFNGPAGRRAVARSIRHLPWFLFISCSMFVHGQLASTKANSSQFPTFYQTMGLSNYYGIAKMLCVSINDSNSPLFKDLNGFRQSDDLKMSFCFCESHVFCMFHRSQPPGIVRKVHETYIEKAVSFFDGTISRGPRKKHPPKSIGF